MQAQQQASQAAAGNQGAQTVTPAHERAATATYACRNRPPQTEPSTSTKRHPPRSSQINPPCRRSSTRRHRRTRTSHLTRLTVAPGIHPDTPVAPARASDRARDQRKQATLCPRANNRRHHPPNGHEGDPLRQTHPRAASGPPKSSVATSTDKNAARAPVIHRNALTDATWSPPDDVLLGPDSEWFPCTSSARPGGLTSWTPPAAGQFRGHRRHRERTTRPAVTLWASRWS